MIERVSKRPGAAISGAENNAFKLLVRVRAAMREGRLGKHLVEAFNHDAGAQEILSHRTIDTPPHVYQRVLHAAARYCDVS